MVRTATILHVSHRFGGGIATSVTQYASALPEHRHLLLCSRDTWSVSGLSSAFEDSYEISGGLGGLATRLNQIMRDQDVDVVHAHSAHAGALVRLLPLRCALVYTPNAFAGLARRWTRPWVAGQAEWALGLRPLTIAAVSEDEAARARRYSPRSRVVRIINIPTITGHRKSHYSPNPHIVMCGRLEPQKSPDFFARCTIAIRRMHPEARLTWIGDGDAQYRRKVEEAGATVTGWLPQSAVYSLLADSSVYMHTGAYEGASVTMLDAAAIGLPTIARPLPGISELPWILPAVTPEDAACHIRTLADQQEWGTAQENTLQQVAGFNSQIQRAMLRSAYNLE